MFLFTVRLWSHGINLHLYIFTIPESVKCLMVFLLEHSSSPLSEIMARNSRASIMADEETNNETCLRINLDIYNCESVRADLVPPIITENSEI